MVLCRFEAQALAMKQNDFQLYLQLQIGSETREGAGLVGTALSGLVVPEIGVVG